VFGKLTYGVWLLLFIGLPLAVLIRWRRLIWPQRRALGLVLLGALGGGWAWDALSVRVGVWFYDPRHIVGAWALGLPLEEWLWIAGVTLMFGALTVMLVETEKGRRAKSPGVSRAARPGLRPSQRGSKWRGSRRD